MIESIIKKHLENFVNPKQREEVAKKIAKEIGEKEVAISNEWVKLKELY